MKLDGYFFYLFAFAFMCKPSMLKIWTGKYQLKFIYFITPNGTKTKIKTSDTVVTLTGLIPSTKYKYNIKNDCPNTSQKFTTTGKFTTHAARAQQLEEITRPIIYPNPGQGVFKISHAESINYIRITDLSGREMLHLVIFNQETAELDLSFLAAGVYAVMMTDISDRVITQKLVIQ